MTMFLKVKTKIKPGLKLFLALLVLSLNSLSAQFDIPPKPEVPTSVYDKANLLSESQENSLRNKLIGYADSTSTQIVVYTVPTIQGENIGMLAPRWAHKWGIGQAEKDNGVFILLASKEREIWIAPGYGVEDKLTAGITGELVRNIIIPEFKQGDYYGGLDKGTNAIIEILEGTYSEERSFNNDGFPFASLLPILIFIVILIILSTRKRRNNGGKGGGRRSSGLDLWDVIILSNMGRSGGSGSSGGFGSGSFGGGGFSGGFGGGGFSGGGAGGSW